MYLLIDNYDSFTFNLYQQLSVLGVEVTVRNPYQLQGLEKNKNIEAVIVSPGPGRPEAAIDCLRYLDLIKQQIPILGICLGHQMLTLLFGGRVIGANAIVHGAADDIFHRSSGLFQDFTGPFKAARYHSLCIDEESLPADLMITARNREGTIMAITHRDLPIFGLQFHPESIMTTSGDLIMRRFIERVEHHHPEPGGRG